MVQKLFPNIIPLMFKKGTRVGFPLFTMYVLRDKGGGAAVIVPKHCGNACDRHRMSRRLRHILFNRVGGGFGDVCVLFVVKKSLLKSKANLIMDVCNNAFNRLKTI